jgi:hypothetical protein
VFKLPRLHLQQLKAAPQGRDRHLEVRLSLPKSLIGSALRPQPLSKRLGFGVSLRENHL